jgi:phosphate transport system substrate-binding protein
MKRIGILAGALAVTMTATSVFAIDLDTRYKPYTQTTGVSGSLKSMGSDSLNNLMTFWAEGFAAHYPSVKIEVEGKGSSTAPPALIAGTAQLGPMSRPMKAAESDAFEAKYGYKPTLVRVGVDTLAVYVHKDNPISCISMSMIDGAFSKSRLSGSPAIKTWGDLGLTGEWASKPISLFGRNSASGTYGYFKEVALVNGDFLDTVKEQPGSSAVVQGVAADKFAMGYSGIGYKTADVKALAVSGRDGKCQEANQTNAYMGNYPITRFLYVYANKNPSAPLPPLLGEFFRYALSLDGQKDTVKDGYYPMPYVFAQEELGKLGLQ